MNDFIKDFIKAIDTPPAKKIINQYERGYITLSETIAALLDEYNNSDFVYIIQYKKAGTKNRYKALSETEYTHKEITPELTRLKDDHPGYLFRQYAKLKEVM